MYSENLLPHRSISMLNNIVLSPHVAPPAQLASASLHVGAGVLLVPAGPLALLLGLVEAAAVVVEMADHHVTHLQIGPEAIIVRFCQISILTSFILYLLFHLLT